MSHQINDKEKSKSNKQLSEKNVKKRMRKLNAYCTKKSLVFNQVWYYLLLILNKN